jgi:hypothetical protein
LLKRISNNVVVSPHGLPPDFDTPVNLYGFKRSNFVAPGTDDFDTSVSCDNRHKDCRGIASNCFPVPSNISSEKHVVFTVTSHTAMDPFEICLPLCVLLISEEQKHRVKVLKISYDAVHNISSKIV